MKIQSLFIILCLTCFSTLNFAEEAQKASEMSKPPSEPASQVAKKRAHKKVEESK